MITKESLEKNATQTKFEINTIFNSNNYFISSDPYDKLNWRQKILQKIGFYKNRPKTTLSLFKKHDNGISEFIKYLN
jgi:hypothetical protein